MKITTKFKVNDIVNHKHGTTRKNRKYGYEVIEIQSVTCSAGTQVFYSCRSVTIEKDFEHKYQEKGDFNWIVGHGLNDSDHSNAWHKFREDELIPISKDFLKILKDNTANL